jgi:hypothetical protein
MSRFAFTFRPLAEYSQTQSTPSFPTAHQKPTSQPSNHIKRTPSAHSSLQTHMPPVPEIAPLFPRSSAGASQDGTRLAIQRFQGFHRGCASHALRGDRNAFSRDRADRMSTEEPGAVRSDEDLCGSKFIWQSIIVQVVNDSAVGCARRLS